MAGAQEEHPEGATRHISGDAGCGKWLQLGGERPGAFLLAERARSEGARSMRAVKGSLGHSPKGR